MNNACDCGGPADPQTNRCLSCGRLKVAASTPVKPIAARARPSPSSAYRVVDARPTSPPPAPVAAPSVAEFGRAIGVEPPRRREPPPGYQLVDYPAPSDDDGDTPDDRFTFGSPTIKRYCYCGGITVSLVGSVLPPRCAFCGREQTWAEADMVATFGARA